ncbi:thioredoxin family protein [Helicobacter sp. MIT 21-1697]|uniref:SoxW family protein n=1 Tax=Helicobacter sp. MIT 21-1697 TaxID=2993733 RepID=UPI00224AE243|nr:thioredoxin family protein [Helicobacter sp. MIT 21-1697]MCX2717760.1 thioredoxin family protein [Helicobacter sp. MIT 21-1697]
MNKIWTITAIICAMMIHCGCNDDNEVKISQGTALKQEHIEQAENLDKQSYAGLENIFLDTKAIQGQEGKITLLIFGKNNCIYCDKIKDDIKNNDSLKDTLKANFLPYYINISYTKNHTLQFQNTHSHNRESASIPTSTLVETYVKSPMRPTPTLVFLTPAGERIYELPGYLPSEQILILLKYMQSQKWQGKSLQDISLEINESLSHNF